MVSIVNNNLCLNSQQPENPYPLFARTNNNACIDEMAFIALMDEPLTYVREYSLATGNINAGFLLSYLVSITEPEQWIKLNSDLIRQEIGLTGNEYRLARSTLLGLDILKNIRLTTPKPGSYYLINEKRVDELMVALAKPTVLDLAAVPLSINRLQHKAIISKRGSVKAGIFLAAIQELVIDEPFNERGNFSKWVEITNDHIMKRIALSRDEFPTTQKYLLQKGIIELNTKGFPKKNRYRVSYQKLAQLTASYWAKNS